MSTTRKPRLIGPFRTAAAEDLAELYMAGATIRSLAERTGRSYGGTRALLLEAGITLRTRGGGQRKTATR
jgi:Helix-turn-helix domain